MKKFFYLALAAAAMASCSSDESITSPEVTAEAAGDAVSFGVYSQTTRSKIEDQSTVERGGFGVFAFSQMTEDIASYTKQNYMPDFMYNQNVNRPVAAGDWVYAPIKYWPNNPGAKLSFYAYAPYFKEFNNDVYVYTPESNDYSNENKTVDSTNVRLILGYDSMGPAIEYTRSSVATEGVDLLWGADKKLVTASATSITAPVNYEKQKVDEKIEFTFKHAMSRLYFNVQVFSDQKDIVSVPDGTPATNGLAENTKIVIQKVELIGNFANKGTLRLYDGTWKIEKGDYSNLVFEKGMGHFSKAVEDSLELDDAKNEIDLLVGKSFDAAGTLLSPDKIDNFVMVMPGASFYIQITYDVITTDPANPKNSSKVTNVIKSTDANVAFNPSNGFAGGETGKYKLEAGKAYNFHLNIGMTTVKFDAEVEVWDPFDQEIALPENN